MVARSFLGFCNKILIGSAFLSVLFCKVLFEIEKKATSVPEITAEETSKKTKIIMPIGISQWIFIIKKVWKSAVFKNLLL